MDTEDVTHIYNEYELWMDLTTSIQTEISQRKTNIIYDHIYVEEKVTTEDEMARWHRRYNGHESE